MTDPKCPYCGNPMRLFVEDNRQKVPRDHPDYWECAKDWQFVAFYTCDMCNRRTMTTIKSPQAHGSDLEKVKIEAFAEAMARPLQKPLTLQKLHKLIRSGDDVAIYCESKGDDHAYATILYDGNAIERDCTKIRSKSLVFENYGIGWRAWAQRPTDKERAAAPWEEDADADL